MASFLVSLNVSILSWRNRNIKSGFYLALLMTAVSEWAFTGAFEAAANQTSLKILWSQLSYLGIVLTPLFYLLLALSYSNNEKLITKRNLGIASVIPLLTLIAAITSNHHQWLWIDVSITETGNIGIYKHGFWFLIFTAYSYLMILIGMLLILRAVKQVSSVFRGQILIIVTGAAMPLLGNVVYVFGDNPIPGLDWTPIAFGFTGILMSAGIFRFNLVNIGPISRKLLVETLNDGVLLIDTNKLVLDINPSMAAMLKRSPRQVIGKPYSEVLAGWKEAQRCLDENRESHITIIDHKDNLGAHYDFRVKRMQNRDGTNIGRLVVCRDISQRIQAKLALKESEEKYRDLFDKSDDAILILADGRFVDCNQATVKMLHAKDKKALLQTHPAELSPDKQPDGKSSFEKAEEMMKIALERGSNRFEWNHKRLDGEIFPVEVLLTSIPSNDGRIKIHTVWRDISERKLAEETLVESEKKIRNLMESVPVGISISTPEGDIHEVNTGMLEIFGFDSKEEFINTSAKSLYYHSKDRERFIALANKGLAIGLESEFKRKDGSVFWGSMTSVASKTKTGNTEYFNVLENITDRKQSEAKRESLESQLRQSQKLEALGTMVGGISHEINNILQSIFLYGGLIKEKLPDDDNLRTDLEHILEDGERAKDIVKQILTFSRKSQVDMILQPLHSIVMESLALERASFPANIEIKQNIDMNCGSILCDKTQIHQIVINLCNNAQHAMKENGGILTVDLRQTKASIGTGNPRVEVLELLVSDTGDGIDPSDLDKVFDPFFTTKQIGGGTGLGLSVIHGIVEMMEGSISVSSKPGVRTTFKLLFPIVIEGSVDEMQPDTQPASNDINMEISILLVDDNDSIRTVMETVLTRKGFIITSASNGQLAFDLFMTNPEEFDLIITDQSMPMMSGTDLAKAIRGTNSNIPIILSTGQLGIEDQKEFTNIGITSFIKKPWTADELIGQIQELEAL